MQDTLAVSRYTFQTAILIFVSIIFGYALGVSAGKVKTIPVDRSIEATLHGPSTKLHQEKIKDEARGVSGKALPQHSNENHQAALRNLDKMISTLNTGIKAASSPHAKVQSDPVLPSQQVAAEKQSPELVRVDKEIAIESMRVSGDHVSSTLKDIANKIDGDWVISYPSANERESIYVFTDYSCPFCRKLHRSIGLLNSKGVSVNYLLFPRSYSGSVTGRAKIDIENFSNAWCSDNYYVAFDRLFNGRSVPAESCSNNGRPPSPVMEHLMLGDLMGVNGTPFIFTKNGYYKEGFENASELIEFLELD